MKKTTPPEIKVLKDMAEVLIREFPRLMSYIETLEIEVYRLKAENKMARQDLFAAETKLHDIAIKKDPTINL